MLHVKARAGDICPGDVIVTRGGHRFKVRVTSRAPSPDRTITLVGRYPNDTYDRTLAFADPDVLVEMRAESKAFVARLGDALDTFPDSVRVGLIRSFCPRCGRRGCVKPDHLWEKPPTWRWPFDWLAHAMGEDHMARRFWIRDRSMFIGYVMSFGGAYWFGVYPSVVMFAMVGLVNLIHSGILVRRSDQRWRELQLKEVQDAEARAKALEAEEEGDNVRV